MDLYIKRDIDQGGERRRSFDKHSTTADSPHLLCDNTLALAVTCFWNSLLRISRDMPPSFTSFMLRFTVAPCRYFTHPLHPE